MLNAWTEGTFAAMQWEAPGSSPTGTGESPEQPATTRDGRIGPSDEEGPRSGGTRRQGEGPD